MLAGRPLLKFGGAAGLSRRAASRKYGGRRKPASARPCSTEIRRLMIEVAISARLSSNSGAARHLYIRFGAQTILPVRPDANSELRVASGSGSLNAATGEGLARWEFRRWPRGPCGRRAASPIFARFSRSGIGRVFRTSSTSAEIPRTLTQRDPSARTISDTNCATARQPRRFSTRYARRAAQNVFHLRSFSARSARKNCLSSDRKRTVPMRMTKTRIKKNKDSLTCGGSEGGLHVSRLPIPSFWPRPTTLHPHPAKLHSASERRVSPMTATRAWNFSHAVLQGQRPARATGARSKHSEPPLSHSFYRNRRRDLVSFSSAQMFRDAAKAHFCAAARARNREDRRPTSRDDAYKLLFDSLVVYRQQQGISRAGCTAQTPSLIRNDAMDQKSASASAHRHLDFIFVPTTLTRLYRNGRRSASARPHCGSMTLRSCTTPSQRRFFRTYPG